MAVRLTRGTKESVQVQVTDATNNMNDLSGTSPHFDVKEDDGTAVVTNQAATADGMLISCLCDTTTWDTDLQHVNLYVKFTAGSEVPRLGPFDVYIVG
jgi:hypothetical protein